MFGIIANVTLKRTNLRSRGTSNAEVAWLKSITNTAPKLGTLFLFLSMVGSHGETLRETRERGTKEKQSSTTICNFKNEKHMRVMEVSGRGMYKRFVHKNDRYSYARLFSLDPEWKVYFILKAQSPN